MKKFVAILFTVLLAGCLFGCGGSSSGSSSSSQPRPENGTIFRGANSGGNSGIEVKSPSSDVYVKVVSSSGKVESEFYVRAGMSARVGLPAGTYNVRFAMGDNWYGTSDYFGKNTEYGEDPSVSLAYGDLITYTLSPSANGNWNMSGLNASEF